MIDYDWKCKKCSRINKAGTSKCLSCGFSAYGSGEELEASSNPDGIALLKTQKKLTKKITLLCYAPLYTVVAILFGDIFSLAIITSAVLALASTEKHFIGFVFTDSWARKTIPIFILTTAPMLIIKFLMPAGTTKNIMILMWLSLLAGMTWYLFKSKASKEFLNRYYQSTTGSNPVS